jgi:hypothetical protein
MATCPKPLGIAVPTGLGSRHALGVSNVQCGPGTSEVRSDLVTSWSQTLADYLGQAIMKAVPERSEGAFYLDSCGQRGRGRMRPAGVRVLPPELLFN